MHPRSGSSHPRDSVEYRLHSSRSTHHLTFAAIPLPLDVDSVIMTHESSTIHGNFQNMSNHPCSDKTKPGKKVTLPAQICLLGTGYESQPISEQVRSPEPTVMYRIVSHKEFHMWHSHCVTVLWFIAYSEWRHVFYGTKSNGHPPSSHSPILRQCIPCSSQSNERYLPAPV